MNIKLIKPTINDKEKIIEMLKIWKEDIEKNKTNGSPSAIFRNMDEDFQYYLDNLDTKENIDEGKVASTTLFCYDMDRKVFVGAVNIRHSLNEHLLQFGGHIGDGIRPDERRKGYATAMIGLALEECKKLGIGKVLMTCDKTNIGSAKSIINNGGILENEVLEDGKIVQRYWIDNKGIDNVKRS